MYKLPCVINIYFGVPGSGKTTFASWLVKRDLKHSIPVWSNVPIKGAFVVDKSDLGHFLIENGHLIWDEAGLDFDNREFKSNFKDRDLLYFFKYHRHYNVAIDVFSQDVDIDKKIRSLAQNLYIVHRSVIPGFVYRRCINKFVGIDDISKQLTEQYQFVPFSRKYIFCPPLWKLFNSYDRKPLPDKDWEVWTDDKKID